MPAGIQSRSYCIINAAKQQTGFFLATAGDGHKGPIDPVFTLSIAAAQFNLIRSEIDSSHSELYRYTY